MQGKYTPGPWLVGKENIKKQRISIDTNATDQRIGYTRWEGLARVYGCDDDKSIGSYVMRQNAMLVAAAPELFEALVDLLDCIETAIKAGDWKVDGACDPDAALDRARRAIAKATGKSWT